MKIRSWKKPAAALICALLLGTSQAQAIQQIGKAVSSKPGEGIPSVSAQGVNSLDSPDVAPAAPSLLASPTDNPANLAPAPGLTSKSAPTAQPRPDATAGQIPTADNALSNTSLPAPSGLRSPAPIEGHAMAALQTATANPRPARRRPQFRLRSLFKLISITAMALGLRQSYLQDTKKLEEPLKWQHAIEPKLQDLAEGLNSQNPVKLSQAQRYEFFLDRMNKIDEEVYRISHGEEPHSDIWFVVKQQNRPLLEFRAMLRDKPTAWTKEELDELFRQYSDRFKEADERYGDDFHRNYTFLRQDLEFAARIHEFQLKAHQDPRRSANPSRVYLDFLREVKPHDPLMDTPSDQQQLQGYYARARRLLDTVNSLDAKQRWLKIKHGILAALATAIAVTPLALLARGIKFFFPRVKKSATRPESTPLMGAADRALPRGSAASGRLWGAALFALTGSNALFDTLDIGDVTVSVLGAAVLATLGYLAWRSRAKLQFSLSGLFKVIAMIALLLGGMRMAAQDRFYLDEFGTLNFRLYLDLKSLKDFKHAQIESLVPSDESFSHYELFQHRLHAIHGDIRDSTITRKDWYWPFDSLGHYYRRNIIAQDLIEARQTPSTDSELKVLYEKYLDQMKGEGEPISYEEFALIADAHGFYLRVRNDPTSWEDPQALYLAFLHTLAQHDQLKNVDLKQLERKARARLDAINSFDKRKREIFFKEAGFTFLALGIIGCLIWPRRPKKAAPPSR